MSNIAKVIPQFLGQLCLVKVISGIDQEFIRYVFVWINEVHLFI